MTDFPMCFHDGNSGCPVLGPDDCWCDTTNAVVDNGHCECFPDGGVRCETL